jgi:hypothetical protein
VTLPQLLEGLLRLDEVFSPLLGAASVLLVSVSFASHGIVEPPDTVARVSAQVVVFGSRYVLD